MKIELAIEWKTHELEIRGPQSGDSKSFFLINNKSFFDMKIELAIEWETHELEMRGPHYCI